MQRFGEPALRGIKYSERAGAYAVLMRDNRFLMTYQERPLAEYQLPGGGIDHGESAIQALHREVREETGWTIRIAQRLGVYQRFTYMPDYDLWARKICHIYLGHPTLRSGPPTEAYHEAVWLEPSEALARVASDGDAWFMRRMLRRTLRP
jgi:8-oxo-dGTP diphosphatase